MNKITINNYKDELDTKFLETLNEILNWFNYTVKFEGDIIKLRVDDTGRTEEFNNEEDTNYDNFDKFLEDWIYTCDEPMREDPEIDYSDWLDVLKSYRKSI